MAKDLFNRYIWLVDVIYRAGRITFDEINEKWKNNDMSGGEELPKRTFRNHLKEIETIFDINIECEKNGQYCYYIENLDDMKRGGIRNWLFDSFAVNNLISESRKLKQRILLEEVPSGRQYLAPIVEAMRDNKKIELTYQSFRSSEPYSCIIEPYCVKLFKQRWYVVARKTYKDTTNAVRIYSLDRIKDYKITNEEFDYPKDFDPHAFFYFSFGIIVENECREEKILIKVYGDKCKYFQTLPLHFSQQEIEKTQTYSVFEYTLCPTFDFRQELLSHGNAVEVLSPLSLREKMAEIVKEMGDIYKQS